jgi:uncharacterized protein with ParB-like and HNH nuclease domain
MEELHSINSLNLLAIPELCNKNFFIPDYQRGYRWGDTQIRQMLEDIYSFIYDKNAAGSFYCLQPVVVKKMTSDDVAVNKLDSAFDNNTWYEVIDGQQRLTTIRIILALESQIDRFNKMRFNMYYQTRPELGKLFDKLRIDEEDERFIVKFDNDDNQCNDIDSWHIHNAANKILDWFQNGSGYFQPSIQEFKGGFYENFSNTKEKDKSVQVIWYELCDKSDPYEMFKRLNDKSISLNNAELIRGMFLSDSAVYKGEELLLSQFDEDVRPIVEKRELARKQSHIIEEWDIIEKQLWDDKFWSFIKKDKNSDDYSCRIEYIFDLISKKTSNQKDSLYTYLEFDGMLKSGAVKDLWDLWLKVKTYFSLLIAWYNDRYYYHKIGFLTTELGSSVLIEMLSESTNVSKQEFKKTIEGRINSAIHDKKKPGRKILDYTYKDDYNMLKRVLFLYNVETTYKQGLEFFPFERYKDYEWTLEHIHAQNSERIDHSIKDKWVEWFEENKKVLERLSSRLPNDENLTLLISFFNNEYNRLINNKDRYTFNDVTKVFDLVLKYFNDLSAQEGTPTVMHGISNMALLSGSTNASIGNSVFEVKRQMIMDDDAKGNYIPLCTRKVFLKYYNKNDQNFTVQQNFYWSDKDRKHYLEDIKEVLKPYIDAENQQSESEVTNE